MDTNNEQDIFNNDVTLEDRLEDVGKDKMDDILANFDHFKGYLGEKVDLGQKLGLSNEQIASTAKKVSEFLSKHEEPHNREEKLLNELWNVASDDEKDTLANMLVKLVD